jgi:hypothetical protein
MGPGIVGGDGGSRTRACTMPLCRDPVSLRPRPASCFLLTIRHNPQRWRTTLSAAPRYRPGSFWSSARRATPTLERRTTSNCQGWSRTSGHLFQRQGSVPAQSAWQCPGGPRPGCVPARLSKGSLGQEDPRSSSGPRVTPDGDRTRPTKKPRARRRGRGWQTFEASITSFVHPARRCALSAPAHGKARSPPSRRSGSSLGRR